MKLKNTCLALAGLSIVSAGAVANDLDDRWYLSAGIGYAFGDDDRELPGLGWDVDGGPAAFVGVGKAINEWLNLELNFKGNQYDLGSGNGNWNQYGATLDGLFFFNRNPGFAPYAVLGAGALHSDTPGDNETSPVVEAGLGVMRMVNDDGDTLRAEVRHRWDFSPDLDLPGGNDTFNDWLVMVGVTVALGERPAKPVPVAVVEPAPMPAPPPPAPVTEVVVLKDVYFCFDCYELSDEAKGKLDENALALISKRPKATFELAGHTDSIGSEAYNLRLSQKRVDSVRDYLIEKGVDGTRMTARGYGESQPVADNGTAAGRAENRRVELRITE